jgi:hypothetical protein
MIMHNERGILSTAQRAKVLSKKILLISFFLLAFSNQLAASTSSHRKKNSKCHYCL